MDPSVLILDHNSSPCPVHKCDSLVGLVQRFVAVKCIEEKFTFQLPERLVSVPDLILLRASAGRIVQEFAIALDRSGEREQTILTDHYNQVRNEVWLAVRRQARSA